MRWVAHRSGCVHGQGACGSGGLDALAGIFTLTGVVPLIRLVEESFAARVPGVRDARALVKSVWGHWT